MKIISISFLMLLLFSCEAQNPPSNGPSTNSGYESIGITGDKIDVNVPTEFGIVLMGGSTDVDEALQWMINKASGGDVIIIRASGSTGYNDYIYSLGSVNSVETLMIDSRTKAMNINVGKRIREAEMLFIAGGDQADYVAYWKNTEVSEAIQYLIDVKKVPIGGTSAGCAVLSDISFDASNGTAVSTEVLSNPYHSTVRLSKSFIVVPFLTNLIADQHYSQREREGRHVTFLARMTKDFGINQPKGIGVDEKTAVCIDEEGNATVYGSNKAYFLTSSILPETCLANNPLTWDQRDHALQAFIFQAALSGTPACNLHSWPTGISTENWFVEDGILKRISN